MKNVYLLPTDKPSRIHVDLRSTFLTPNYQIGKEINSVVDSINIYITSDEEIKEGDWVIYTNGIVHCQKMDYKEDLSNVEEFNAKKIILTTDQDLINNGIQAIDDEFLEWFIKNPSCEEVEVNFVTKQMVEPYDVYNESVSLYKTIIPKEEPKQSTKNRILSETSEKTKQKARNYGNSLITKLNMTSNRIKEIQAETAYPQSRSVHQALLKVWNECEQKQERMYSEEEVIKILLARIYDLGIICKTSEVVEFIKQFKNK